MLLINIFKRQSLDKPTNVVNNHSSNYGPVPPSGSTYQEEAIEPHKKSSATVATGPRRDSVVENTFAAPGEAKEADLHLQPLQVTDCP